MLTQIDVVYSDETGEKALALPILGITPKESLLLRQVTGLNPPDITLFIGDYARDGGIYQGRRVGNRNVVLTIDLNPNPALGETVDGLRVLLYKTFIDPLVEADYVQLILHRDLGSDRYVVGYAEKFETEIFDSEKTVQISLICPDPYIRDNIKTSLVPPVGTSGWTRVPFTYGGSAETGFEVEIHMVSASSRLILDNNSVTDDINSANYNRGRMILDSSFQSTDVIYVNTNSGSRDARVVSASQITSEIAAMPITDRWAALSAAGVTRPLIGNLSPLSPWLELHSSNNVMRIYGTDPGNTPAVITELAYNASYWGI